MCTALPARIGALADLAGRAHQDNDLTAAARVYNQAALIASDCGQPDLARQWCHRHARAWLDRGNLDNTLGRKALEPLVNLARLHIRAGDHDDGLTLLTNLYQAITHRTDTTIDSIPLPAAALTPTQEIHRDLSRWLWGVHLADGTRALTSAGRWDEAEAHLQQHHGIGHRMLDGRQVAIIARIQRDQHAAALHLISQTHPGEAWEAAVTACLAAMCQPDGQLRSEHINLMATRYREVAYEPSLIVFQTRLALTMIEVTGSPSAPELESIGYQTAQAAVRAADGYAAREILASSTWTASLGAETRQALIDVLAASGLGRPLSSPLMELLTAAFGQCDAAISNAAGGSAGPIRIAAGPAARLSHR
ncbi:hypothetical protein [Micromonospora sp. NPDC048063]|uniref:hypothetical protein n=1 Tax=Micromonospora sp. NPDC048063 TaxID=3364256 RepID=UPI0037170193